MKRLNQSGIAHLGILLAFVVVIVGLVGWQVMSATDKDQSNNSTAQTQDSNSPEADIALQNLGLASLDSVEITNSAVREYTSQGLKGFYIFGDKLSGGRTNPNFEFASVKADADVVASIDGIVAFIREQPDSKDSEVSIQPRENSAWTISYDHIVDLKVKKGATIKAGDVIGHAAVQNNGLRRFEIQINKDKDGVTTHVCPTSILAVSVRDKILNDLKAMQNSWESTTGYDLYDVVNQNPIGCTKATMTVKEAEG